MPYKRFQAGYRQIHALWPAGWIVGHPRTSIEHHRHLAWIAFLIWFPLHAARGVGTHARQFSVSFYRLFIWISIYKHMTKRFEFRYKVIDTILKNNRYKDNIEVIKRIWPVLLLSSIWFCFVLLL